MSNSKKLVALLRSHLNGDEEQFYNVALQIAANHARSGHVKLAEELKKVIDQAKSKESNFFSTNSNFVSPTPIDRPGKDLTGLLDVKYSETFLNSMTLSGQVLLKLKRLIEEYNHQNIIRSHGLVPIRKILLFGPPGTGKTMTALALAGELRLPLLTVRLDGLITKYMGETAAKLRLIFDHMRNNRGVYFFDEFDSIGAKRVRDNDVGEIRRVLNSFLHFVEDDTSSSIMIAATNHPEILDNALFRRFDNVIQYKLPSLKESIEIIQNHLSVFDKSNIDWNKIKKLIDGLSQSEITRATNDAAKTTVMKNSTCISQKALEESIISVKEKMMFPSSD